MDKAERQAQLIDEYQQGVEAKSLVDNKIWKEAIAHLESSYIGSIRSGSWLKKRAREENCRRLQVLDDLVNIINNKILLGEQARVRLDQARRLDSSNVRK